MEKITFGKIKEDVTRDKKYNAYSQKKAYFESNGVKRSNWKYYDSDMREFAHSFAKALPKSYVDLIEDQEIVPMEEYGGAFKAYIENTLRKNTNRTAIEFGGPGSVLFSQFSEGFFSKTIGVSLEDLRDQDDREEDIKNNHYVYVGNILDTKNKNFDSFLHHEQQIQKVDLIISRMMGPLNGLSKNPLVMEKVVKYWYSLLKENSILFAQFEYHIEHNPNEVVKYYYGHIAPCEESKTEIQVKEWADVIKKQYGNTIDIQLGRGVLRLEKKPGAPDELPLYKDLIKE